MIPPSIYELLDRVHFMSYDMVGGGNGENDDRYHASLPKVERALDELLAPGGGLDTEPQRRKVLLGIPAYARHLRNPSDVQTVAELHDRIFPTDDGDGVAGGGTLSSPDRRRFRGMHSWGGYEWESPRRIRAKIDLVRDRGLGGIFFWELGQDKATAEHPGGILLEAAVAAAETRPAAAAATAAEL